ncbi:uncharacterized protein LOC112681161, partial [Sipha flava]|uniref:Uncharacterized protein LOC112681161 n=1 Tax=Sipha flava TaxID=143950 RepID=A0A8B8F8W6_9HEMI
RNIIKSAKLTGSSYVNHRKKQVPALIVGEPCRCRNKCFEKYGFETIQAVFDFFHNFEHFQTKDEQDQYLQGLIDVVAVKRRRKSTKDKLNDGEDPKRDYSFNYHVMFVSARKGMSTSIYFYFCSLLQKNSKIKGLKSK